MCFWFTFGHLGRRARLITLRSLEYLGMSVYMVYGIKVQGLLCGGAVGVPEGFLESCLLIMCTTIPVFGNFFPCCTRGKESEKAHWEGTREWVSYSCFYLSCRCNAFGPNANCLGHTRFIQIDLALLSGNGLLNVNFRINSTRAAQTITLCLGEVEWGAECRMEEERGNWTIAWNF